MILSAYSAANSGDGLLADLAVKALRRNFGAGARITVVAADPASFCGLSGVEVRQAPLMATAWRDRMVSALNVKREYSLLDRLFGEADLLVGIGGGYMRSKSLSEHAKLEAGHAWQLRCAVKSGVPLVCLPQSIGPFHAMTSRYVDLYRSAATVFVRDDRSRHLVRDLEGVVRCPDMAVQHVALRLRDRDVAMATDKRVPESVCVVLRKPPAWSESRQRAYVSNVKELVRLLSSQCRVLYGVQSVTRGNDDVRFYRENKIGQEYVALRDCLSDARRPDMVVSVRLHGALESVIAGVPAFHLSYERKGFGAYEDMRADNWVCNGADFRPDAVLGRLFEDYASADFAQRLQSGVAAISKSADGMDAVLRRFAR